MRNIIVLRDLRVVVVSHFRWLVRQGFITMPDKIEGELPANSDLSGSLLLDYLNGPHRPVLFGFVEAWAQISNDPFVRLVRFEEMVSPDREVRLNPAQPSPRSPSDPWKMF